MIPANIPHVSFDLIESGEPDIEGHTAKFVTDKLVPLVPEKVSIITFDGFDGVGKSSLARHLAASLKLPVIDLDDFLEEHQDCFLEALKFTDLSRAITNALFSHRKVIVAGCLVETALERTGNSPDFLFYVMRTARMLSRPDIESIDEFDTLYGEKSADQLIADLEEMMEGWTRMPEEFGGGGSGDIPNLERELIRYHRERRPHDKADLIVKITRLS